MTQSGPQDIGKPIDEVLSVADTQFNREYPQLIHVEKKVILAVLECSQDVRSRNGLEGLVITNLYPDILLDCHEILETLRFVADISRSGPATAGMLQRAPTNLNIEPASAIRDLRREYQKLRWGLPTLWGGWVMSDTSKPGFDRDTVQNAFNMLNRHFSNIREVNTRLMEKIEDMKKQPAPVHILGVENVTKNVQQLLEAFANELNSCEHHATEREKAEIQGVGSYTTYPQQTKLPSPDLHSSSPLYHPYDEKKSTRQHLLVNTWLWMKTQFEQKKQEVMIWNENVQEAEDWVALVILLVINPVVWILLAALPFTVISTLLCEMPEDVPLIDSNFHSTLSQTVASLAGLFAIVAGLRRPRLGHKKKKWKIESKFPKTFVVLLCVSVLSGFASVVVYPWQSPSSIPLAFVSNMAQNVATSLIVQGSSDKIMELEMRQG